VSVFRKAAPAVPQSSNLRTNSDVQQTESKQEREMCFFRVLWAIPLKSTQPSRLTRFSKEVFAKNGISEGCRTESEIF